MSFLQGLVDKAKELVDSATGGATGGGEEGEGGSSTSSLFASLSGMAGRTPQHCMFRPTCVNGNQCAIFKAAKDDYVFNNETLQHLQSFEHGARVPCRHGKECYAFQRCSQQGWAVADVCHMLLYQHPARRAHTDASEVPSNFLQGQSVRGGSRGARFFGSVTYATGPQRALESNHLTCHREARADLFLSDPQQAKQELIAEMAKNDCTGMLTTPEGASLWSVAQAKLRHSVHEGMGTPLNEAEMIAIILYCGCDMYKNYRMSELRSEFDTWPCFSQLLTQAILKLSAADKRPAPDMVWHGLSGISMPTDKSLAEQEGIGGYGTQGQLPFVYGTAVSTTYSQQVALEFAGEGSGSLLQIQLNLPPGRDASHGTKRGYWNRTAVCPLADISADVSWISKFPDECERLFPGGLFWFSSGRARNHLGNFEVLEVDSMSGQINDSN